MVKKEKITTDEALRLMESLTGLLTPEEREEFRSFLKIENYAKGRNIYNEGEIPTMMFCVLKGKVKIYKEKDVIVDRSQIFRVLRPVQYFGYRAFFADQNYLTTASTFEQSVIASVPIDFVRRLTDANIRVSNFFVRELAIDLGTADMRTVSLTQKHIRGRLAEALLWLRESYGLEEDGATLSIYLSREDLANISNMTTSNAIRTLSAFATEHIVAIDGRKIKLLDMDALDKISRLG